MHKMVQTKADIFFYRKLERCQTDKMLWFLHGLMFTFCSMYFLCNASVSSPPLLCSLHRLEKLRSEIWQNSPLIRNQVGVAGVEGEG